jgi:hypothetical protein
MSQSGITIVSDTAKVVSNIGSSVGDIASGKNIFEAVGRIAAQPLSFAGATLSSASFGYVDKVPVLGGFSKAGTDFQNNPYSRSNALSLGRSSATLGAAAVGAIIGGPLIASQLGLGAGASSLAGGALASKLVQGDVAGALSTATSLGGNYLNGTELGQAFAPYSDSIKGAISTSAKSGVTPINNITPAAQVLNTTTGFSGSMILVFGLVAVAGYMAMKRKLI